MKTKKIICYCLVVLVVALSSCNKNTSSSDADVCSQFPYKVGSQAKFKIGADTLLVNVVKDSTINNNVYYSLKGLIPNVNFGNIQALSNLFIGANTSKEILVYTPSVDFGDFKKPATNFIYFKLNNSTVGAKWNEAVPVPNTLGFVQIVDTVTIVAANETFDYKGKTYTDGQTTRVVTLVKNLLEGSSQVVLDLELTYFCGLGIVKVKDNMAKTLQTLVDYKY